MCLLNTRAGPLSRPSRSLRVLARMNRQRSLRAGGRSQAVANAARSFPPAAQDRIAPKVRPVRGVPRISLFASVPFTVAVYCATDTNTALLLFIVPAILNHMFPGPVVARTLGLGGVIHRASAAAFSDRSRARLQPRPIANLDSRDQRRSSMSIRSEDQRFPVREIFCLLGECLRNVWQVSDDDPIHARR